MLRLLFLLGINTKYIFIFAFVKLRIIHTPKQKLLKQYFEDAGGSFIKFGQLLALRIEALPDEYSAEMLDLLDNIQPFSYSKVQELFIQELGVSPKEMFKDFESKPFASASFGQVHAAKLADDTVVAVKLLRPGIEEVIEVDFAVIRLLARIADKFFKIEALTWKEFAEEFISWTRQEVDYHIEAENAERLRSGLLKTSKLVIPRIYFQYSTKRILVEEYLEGMHMNKVLRGIREKKVDHQKMLSLGVDTHRIAPTLIQELMYQYFFPGFFHGDPHPGNIILLPHGKIGLIDFGIVGESVATNQSALIKFLKHITNFEFQEACINFMDIAGLRLKQIITSAFPASTSPEEINCLVAEIASQYAKKVGAVILENATDLKDLKKSYLSTFLDVFKTANKYNLHVPKEVARFTRTIGIIGMMGKQLDVDFVLADEFNQFFKDHEHDQFPSFQANTPQTRRMSREVAIEKLNNWLVYLIEVDPSTFQIVKDSFSKYN